MNVLECPPPWEIDTSKSKPLPPPWTSSKHVSRYVTYLHLVLL